VRRDPPSTSSMQRTSSVSVSKLSTGLSECCQGGCQGVVRVLSGCCQGIVPSLTTDGWFINFKTVTSRRKKCIRSPHLTYRGLSGGLSGCCHRCCQGVATDVSEVVSMVVKEYRSDAIEVVTELSGA